MKKICLIVLMSFCLFANAQKLTLASGNKILEGGNHIANFEKTSSTYTVVTNLDEDELLNIETLTDDDLSLDYYQVNFSDDNQSVAYLPFKKSKENILEEVLRAKILKDGALAPESIKLFCQKNTLEALQKKPLAKQKKEILKEEKIATKAEKDEEKEEWEEEKAEANQEKKDLKADEKLEKAEDRKDKIAEKKDAAMDRKETAEANKIESKTNQKELEENESPKQEAQVVETVIIDNGKIKSGNKIIGSYTATEGLIKNKKGKTVIILNKQNKRVAIAKYQYNAQDASIQNMQDKSWTDFKIYSETEININMEIIDQALKMKLIN